MWCLDRVCMLAGYQNLHTGASVSCSDSAALQYRPHACLLAAQNSAACAKLSPGLMPFCTSSSLPPLPTTTWLHVREDREDQQCSEVGPNSQLRQACPAGKHVSALARCECPPAFFVVVVSMR